jgi:hypothetical protein
MSTYLAIIETSTITAPVQIELMRAAVLEAIPPEHKRYWIGPSSDPLHTRAGFAHVYPFAHYRVIHTIRSDNRTELLYSALKMKLRAKLIVDDWYKLSPDDLTWLQSITTDNYAQMIPQIENEIARLAGVEARDVTRDKKKRCAGVIVVADESSLEEMKQRLLDQIEGMK